MTGHGRAYRFTLFGALYFAQGLPFGFASVTLSLYLQRGGLDPVAIGEFLALPYLPFALKPILGPLVDRLDFGRLGRKRPWLLACQLGIALASLALATVDPLEALALFQALLVVQHTFCAAQDVATDALAVEVLEESERGRVNGIMRAAQYGGVLVGGPLFQLLLGGVGLRGLYAIVALLTGASSLLVLGLREGPRPAALSGGVLRQAVRSLAVPAAFWGMVFMLVADPTDNLLSTAILKVSAGLLGFSDAGMSGMSTLGIGAAISGALVGAAVADRVGRRRAIALFCAAVALCHLAFAGILGVVGASAAALIAYTVVCGVVSGVAGVAQNALCMDLVNPRVGATMFTLYMAVSNIKFSYASRLGGHMTAALPLPTIFAAAAAAALIPLVLLPLVDARKARVAYERA